MRLQIRQSETITCDYCGERDKKCVNPIEGYDTDRDICADCILIIYEFMKKEILC